MLSRYFNSSNSERIAKKEWKKEMSLLVPDKNNPKGYCLKVPKRLLLENSKVFREMPEAELKKCRKIQLEEVSIVALQKLVEYMLKSNVIFNNHTEVLETLKAAQNYQMEDLLNICINYLIDILAPINVCEIYETFKSLKCGGMEYRCLRLIDQSSEEVLQSRGFFRLTKATALEIVKRNSLNVCSEVTVFNAILGWGLNNCLSRGIDASDMDKFMPMVNHLFNYVRFSVMTEEELKDPEVESYRGLLSPNEPWNKHRATSISSQSSTSSSELGHHSRQFVDKYTYNLDIFESNQHNVKNGEIFNMCVEILKGKVFLTGLTLVFRPFAATKHAACLSVLLTATNVLTAEEKTTRGTFLNTTEEAKLEFSSSLVACETERIQIVLCVKRAENICPLTIRKDVQIAMPESKSVAMKVTPLLKTSESEESGRCIFKCIDYFF